MIKLITIQYIILYTKVYKAITVFRKPIFKKNNGERAIIAFTTKERNHKMSHIPNNNSVFYCPLYSVIEIL